MENENVSNSRLFQGLTTSGFRGVILCLLMAAKSLQQVNASDSFTSTSKNRGVTKKKRGGTSLKAPFHCAMSRNSFHICLPMDFFYVPLSRIESYPRVELQGKLEKCVLGTFSLYHVKQALAT